MKIKLITIIFIISFGLFSLPVEAKIDIVNPNQKYTYQEMTRDIKLLKKHYPDLIEVKSIGQSEYGREIWAIKLGKGDVNVHFNASHHAREWLTTNLLMEMIDEYSHAYKHNYNVGNYNAKDLLNKTSIWFVPMVNPDGVTLQQGYINDFPLETQRFLIGINNGSKDFTHWKANAKGIDINRQYPADWNNIKNNTGRPAYMNYKGSYPLVSKEAIAMVDFTREIKPEIVVSYHSSGRVLYWHFNNLKENELRDRKIGKGFSNLTKYRLVEPSIKPSGGGYKDWFIKEFNKPGYTPEISYYVGERHVPVDLFPEVWKRNKEVGLYIATEGFKLASDEIKDDQKNDITVTVRGEEVKFLDVKPIIKNGRTLVPVRAILEHLGLKVEWREQTQTVHMRKENHNIILQIGNKKASKNGKEIKLDTAPTILDSRTMVPIRFISESLDLKVEWNGDKRTVTIEG